MRSKGAQNSRQARLLDSARRTLAACTSRHQLGVRHPECRCPRTPWRCTGAFSDFDQPISPEDSESRAKVCGGEAPALGSTPEQRPEGSTNLFPRILMPNAGGGVRGAPSSSWLLLLVLCTEAISVCALPDVPGAGMRPELRPCSGHASEVCSRGAMTQRLTGGDGGRGVRGQSMRARPWCGKASMLYPLLFGPLYFLSVAMAIPATPSLVNTLLSGDNKVTGAGQMKLGSLLATDAFFTLLTTNVWATMSDKYGRQPFIAMSAAGIGVGAAIVAYSSSLARVLGVSPFTCMYVAAAIDGCTSCMFGLGQAYVCDVSDTPVLPANIGLFMGVSAGLGFTFGVPFSAVLMKRQGVRRPFEISAGLALLNTLLALAIVPESLPPAAARVRISWRECNPLAALATLARNRLLAGASLSYFLLWFAHTGLQVTWMNFFAKAHGWSAGKSGGVLAVFGIATAILPRLLLRFMPLTTALQGGLWVYALAMLALAQARADGQVYAALCIAAIGSTSLPSSLSFLANQASFDAQGAMQGATETLKTINSVLAQQAMSAVFAFGLSDTVRAPGLVFLVGSALLAASAAVLSFTLARFSHLDASRPRPAADAPGDGRRSVHAGSDLQL